MNFRRLKSLKHLFEPQWYDIRNQLQEKKWGKKTQTGGD